jgi:hypothetical protein
MSVNEAIAKSQYIFDQDQSMRIIGYIIGGSLISLAIFNVFKIYYYKEGDRLSKPERFVLVVFLLFASPWIPNSINKSVAKNERIIQYAGTATGTTTKRNKGKSPTIEYNFTVYGHTFSSKANPVYGGFTIPNIRVPNGYYLVIYNRLNPNESIINFKVPVNQVKQSPLPSYTNPLVNKPKPLTKQKPIDLKIHP